MVRNKKDNSEKIDIPKINDIELDILSVLRKYELYGVDIRKQINTERPKKISFGSLYPALTRLENKQLIKSRWGDPDEKNAGARRKYYRITALGERSIDAWQLYKRNLWGLKLIT